MIKTRIVVSLLGALPMAAVMSVAEAPHPWLDQQLKKQRYPCPADNSPVRGPADAVVTVTEFGDYECPGTSKEEPTLRKVLEAYPTQVKLVCKNLPLTAIHPKAKEKALVAECMGVQGKYWQAHDRMLAGAPPKKVTEGVDEGKLKACVSRGGEGQVDKDLALAKRLGMATTPGFVIDGIRIGGMVGFEQFKLLIDEELARKAGTK